MHASLTVFYPGIKGIQVYNTARICLVWFLYKQLLLFGIQTDIDHYLRKFY